MKTKSINKLALKKQTVSNLNQKELNAVKGGVTIYTQRSCLTNFGCTNPECCENTYYCKTIGC
jgi:natural product precursor